MTETPETATVTDLAFDYDIPLDIELDGDVFLELELASDVPIDFIVESNPFIDFPATTLALGEEDCNPWEDVFIIAQAPSDAETPVVSDLA